MQEYLNLDLSDDANVSRLRRGDLAQAIKASNYPDIEKILKHLIKKRPDNIQAQIDLVDQSIAHGHMGKATAYYQNITLTPEHHDRSLPDAIYTSLIRVNLQLKDNKRAADFARMFMPAFAKNEKLALFAMRAFDRADELDNFILAAEAVAQLCTNNHNYLAEMAFSLNNRSFPRKVITLLKETPPEESGHFDLLLQYGRALLAVDPMSKRSAEVLEKAHEFGGQQVKSAVLLSKSYTKVSNHKRALAVLQSILQNGDYSAQLESFKAQYADALMACNQYKEAGEIYAVLVKDNPTHGGWRRACISALLLSGDTGSAKGLYREDLKNRDLSKYVTFGDALGAISQQLDTANIPTHRFDWAYEKLDALGCAPEQRDEWEDQCRWVNLADHLTLDWLEARTMDADEILPIIDGADTARDLLNQHTSPKMGAFIATAHVGGLFAGPFALARSGLKYRWVASTPVVSDVPGSEFLLSTFSQSKLGLAKKIFSALKTGAVVSIAIDGTSGAASKPVELFDGTIQLSDFIPRAIFQTGAKCFFPQVFWIDGRVNIKLVQMIEPKPNQTLEDFITLWFDDFIQKLQEIFLNNPNNLRMSGGFWNDVAL